jgi:biopolymer transport protein ExbD
VYLAGHRLSAPVLSERVRTLFSTRNEKTPYIKADARVRYVRLVEVIDAVWKSGVEGVALLTAQRDASDQGKEPVPPKGLDMRVVQP